ncbi:MAG TPA: hypothetical protein VFL51_05900 [Pseudolabrys sp.]|nr:hypothetical protein [Pseudolabrys sp.]
MRLIIPAIALALAAGSLATPPSVQGAQARDEIVPTANTIHHRHRHQVRRYHPSFEEAQPRGQIACTPLGCGRIPPNCHPTTAYYPDGTPTGYDAVACR